MRAELHWMWWTCSDNGNVLLRPITALPPRAYIYQISLPSYLVSAEETMVKQLTINGVPCFWQAVPVELFRVAIGRSHYMSYPMPRSFDDVVLELSPDRPEGYRAVVFVKQVPNG